jgi:hypothetical protein
MVDSETVMAVAGGGRCVPLTAVTGAVCGGGDPGDQPPGQGLQRGDRAQPGPGHAPDRGDHLDGEADRERRPQDPQGDGEDVEDQGVGHRPGQHMAELVGSGQVPGQR